MRIHKTIRNSSITGTIESIDNLQDKLYFNWTLVSNPSVKNWTKLTIYFSAPQTTTNRWLVIVPATCSASFLILFTTAFSNISNACASSTIGAAPILAPIASQTTNGVIASSVIPSSGIITSKVALTVSIVVIGGTGVIVGDVYFYEPIVEYSIYPP